MIAFHAHPMSEEQLKAFLAKAKGDSTLKEKLQSATDAETVVAIAKEAGFNVSADELKNAGSANLSDQELDGVAGSGLGRNCGESSLIGMGSTF